MKKAITLILVLILTFSVMPTALTANAETAGQTEDDNVPCLERDLPHGDKIWEAISQLEDDMLPDCASPEEYSGLLPEIERIVTSSDEYVEGSLEYCGDTLFWETPDGMAHGWSPWNRAEMNGYTADGAEQGLADTYAEQTDDSVIDLSAKDELAATGSDTELAGTELDGSTWARNVMVFAPYHGYSGDNWGDKSSFATDIVKVTGGGYDIKNNQDATIDAIASALQSNGVVIMDTHGSVDRHGTLYDTRISNTSYLCLTAGTGITAADCALITGKFGKYRHAYNSGTSDQADNHTVYCVDGTAIANHMTSSAPNNLFWMNSCLTMATDGLASPLRNKGVGVVFGYSKPSSSYGSQIYEKYFFNSLLNGNNVAYCASYMKQKAGCSWDPRYPNIDYITAVAKAAAFPIFVSANDPYPGQNNVDAIQTVKSEWLLPFKSDATYYTRKFITTVGVTSRASCTFRFNSSVTKAVLSGGSIPDGMTMYKNSDEVYFYGTPTKTGVFTAEYNVSNSAGNTVVLHVEFAVTPTTAVSYSRNYVFTSGEKVVDRLRPASSLFSYQQVSGDLPDYMDAVMGSDGLYIRVRTYVEGGTTKAYYVPAGSYQAVYDIIGSDGTRYRYTLKITVKPHETGTLEAKSFTMAKGCSSVLQLNDTCYYRVELDSGALPDGTMAISRNTIGSCLIGTPTRTGTFIAVLKFSSWAGRVWTQSVTVTVKEASQVSCKIRLRDIYGSTYLTAYATGGSSYKLPEYTSDMPSSSYFKGWWYDGRTYQPGNTVTVNSTTMDIYSLCGDYIIISNADCTLDTPVAGKNPDYSAVPLNSSAYTAEVSYWYLSESPSYPHLSSSDTFVSGKTYRVRVKYTAKAGYSFSDSTVYRINSQIATFVGASTYEVKYTVPASFTVSGTVTSFLNSSGKVTVNLIQSGSVKHTFSAIGNTCNYLISGVSAGPYTLRVSKANHVTRDYSITVSGGNLTKNVKIHPIGDIDGDGAVTTFDYAQVNGHAKGAKLLSGYELTCANVAGNDNVVTTIDAAAVNAHAKGVKLLWS